MKVNKADLIGTVLSCVKFSFYTIGALLTIALVAAAIFLDFLWYPGLTPKQTANIIVNDDKFWGRALRISPLWGDAIYPALREVTNNYTKIRGRRVVMLVLAETNKSAEGLNVSRELYNKTDPKIKMIGAAGLAAQGKLGDEDMMPGGFVYEALSYTPTNPMDLPGDTIMALEVAKYAKSSSLLEPILKILDHRKVYYSLHSKACDALAEIGDKRAIPALESAMKDPNFYAIPHAFNALVKLGDEQAIPLAIARITPEISGKNSEFIIKELERVTGKHYGFDQQKWQDWWEKNNK